MFTAQTIRDRREAMRRELLCAVCVYTREKANRADTVIGGTAACFPCLDEHALDDSNVANVVAQLKYEEGPPT